MVTGLHHTTGITGNPQANLDFYVGLLGLRLVKRTVSHNDSTTMHLFYGDAEGSPGTLLSFFAWPDTAPGRRGHGQAAEVGLIVPQLSIGNWTQHLLSRGVPFEGPTQVGDSSQIKLHDPDGLPLVLVGLKDAPAGKVWSGSSLAEEMQIRGLHHAVLWTEKPAQTGEVLTELLGFRHVSSEGVMAHYKTDAELGHTVYVRDVTGFWSSADGVGILHHVAFRTQDAQSQEQILQTVKSAGLETSEMREHGYFKSIYFREPGGALIEVATDTPGFTLDEPVAKLGESLVLPPALEPERQTIEVTLPQLVLPGGEKRVTRDLGWIHRYVEGAGELTLLLLHGTGGNETDLLGLGRQVAPDAHLLSVRGRSLEKGSPRFFRRFSATRYDQEDLVAEANALAEFTGEATTLYGLDPVKVIALGYSNGANIALASLALEPAAYAGAVLLRPAMTLETPPETNLSGKQVLSLSGRADPFLPFSEAVGPYLRANGAEVTEHLLNAGHELTAADFELSQAWLSERTFK